MTVKRLSDKDFNNCFNNVIKYGEKTGRMFYALTADDGTRYYTNNVFCLKVTPQNERLYNIAVTLENDNCNMVRTETNSTDINLTTGALTKKTAAYFEDEKEINDTHFWCTYSKTYWKKLAGRNFTDLAFFTLIDNTGKLFNNYYKAAINSKLLKNIIGLVLEDADTFQLGFNLDNENGLVYIKIHDKIVGVIGPMNTTEVERGRLGFELVELQNLVVLYAYGTYLMKNFNVDFVFKKVPIAKLNKATGVLTVNKKITTQSREICEWIRHYFEFKYVLVTDYHSNFQNGVATRFRDYPDIFDK